MAGDVNLPKMDLNKYEQYITKSLGAGTEDKTGAAKAQQVLSNMSHNLQAFVKKVHVFFTERTTAGDMKSITNKRIINSVEKKLTKLEENIDRSKIIDKQGALSSAIVKTKKIIESFKLAGISDQEVKNLNKQLEVLRNKANEIQKTARNQEIERRRAFEINEQSGNQNLREEKIANKRQEARIQENYKKFDAVGLRKENLKVVGGRVGSKVVDDALVTSKKSVESGASWSDKIALLDTLMQKLAQEYKRYGVEVEDLIAEPITRKNYLERKEEVFSEIQERLMDRADMVEIERDKAIKSIKKNIEQLYSQIS